MPVNIRDFYTNPAGKGATFLNINATKEKFAARYDGIASRIIWGSCVTRENTLIHVKIPSSVEGIYYDIILGFKPNDKSAGSSIEDMDMFLFSNCPSFLYTYANAYEKHGILIKPFKKKLSAKMLQDVAKSKNPYGVLSYDFSIFAALHFVLTNNLVMLDHLKSIAKYKTFAHLYAAVPHADLLQKQRHSQQQVNRMIREQEKAMRKNALKHPKNGKASSEDDPAVTDAHRAKEAPKAKQAKKVKSTKKAKRV